MARKKRPPINIKPRLTTMKKFKNSLFKNSRYSSIQLLKSVMM